MSSFQQLGFHSRLVRNLASQSFTEPTPVQDVVIPHLLAGKDVLVCAETGSGKTLAYLLPILQELLSSQRPLGKHCPHALILMPTRELAIQVNKEIEWLVKGSGVKSVLLTGGQEFRYQSSLLRRNPEIVVATPGRLHEHLNRQTLAINDVKCLVLDEADRMLDMGFVDEVQTITRQISSQHQTVLLSATLRHRGITQIAGTMLNDPESVQLSSAQEVNPNITLETILVDDSAHKLRVVTWLLSNRKFVKSLLFVKTRDGTEQVATALREHGYDVRVIHGEVTQDDRRKIMSDYREGRFRVLVATDVAARGLDVAGLDLVINLDMAHSGEEFVHRAGRTGRAGEKGTVVSLISPADWSLSEKIRAFLENPITLMSIPGLTAKFKGKKIGPETSTKRPGSGGGRKDKESSTGKSSTSNKTSTRRQGSGKSRVVKDVVAEKIPGKEVTKSKSASGRKARDLAAGKAKDQGLSPFKRPKSPGSL